MATHYVKWGDDVFESKWTGELGQFDNKIFNIAPLKIYVLRDVSQITDRRSVYIVMERGNYANMDIIKRITFAVSGDNVQVSIWRQDEKNNYVKLKWENIHLPKKTENEVINVGIVCRTSKEGHYRGFRTGMSLYNGVETIDIQDQFPAMVSTAKPQISWDDPGRPFVETYKTCQVGTPFTNNEAVYAFDSMMVIEAIGGTAYVTIPTSYYFKPENIGVDTEVVIPDPLIKPEVIDAVGQINGPVKIVYNANDADTVTLSYNIKTTNWNDGLSVFTTSLISDINIDYFVHDDKNVFTTPVVLGVKTNAHVRSYVFGAGDYRSYVTHTAGVGDQVAAQTTNIGGNAIYGGAGVHSSDTVATAVNVTINGRYVGTFAAQPNGSSISFILPRELYDGQNVNYDRFPYTSFE